MLIHRVDHSKFRLGRTEPKPIKRGEIIMLADYIARPTLLPKPLTSIFWSQHKNSWGMMMNDSIGDCTCAALGHGIQVMTLNASAEVTVPDSTILTAYEASGYDPGDPSTDQGWGCQDALNYWMKHGLDGHKIAGWAQIDPEDIQLVKTAIDIFGFVDIGIALPITAQNQGYWSVVPSEKNGDGMPGSWGGHSVVCPDYDQFGFRAITWGMRMGMSYNFWKEYVNPEVGGECYCVFSYDWINSAQSSPSGFAVSDLIADLNEIRAKMGLHSIQ